MTLTVPDRVFHRSMSVDELGGQLVAVEQPEEGDLRVSGGDDDRAGELLAALQRHAVALPSAVEIRGDRRLGADLGAERPGRRGDRRGEATHPAVREPPRPELAVADVADLVVRHHEGGARRPGPAHVPITPETDRTPSICGDSK